MPDAPRDPDPFRLTRRRFLGYVGPAVAAAGALSLPRGIALAADDEPMVETPSDDEGPFYRGNAPERTDLRVADSASPPLTVEGVVRAEDGKVLPGVLLDLWHADSSGRYDMTTRDFRHRGRLKTDAEGKYRLVTNLPGQYGQGLRPRHIHVKLSGQGLYPLTTQIYFLVRPDRDAPRELVVALTWTGEGKDRRASGRWPVFLSRREEEARRR
jgi:protocatechuate 3,4-dioxygenase beta subunit